MNNIDSMINDGVLALNPAVITKSQRTFLVLGAPRGGTSMVAGVMHHLGVYMGDDLLSTFEDPGLTNLMLQSRNEELKQAIIDRNLTHSIWGWKFPGLSILDVLPEISGVLKNPFFLVIYRDVFAMANRNYISAYGDLFANMTSALNYFSELGKFLETNKAPVMLISYEKAMLNPRMFVERISEFMGIGQEYLENAIAFIEPNKPEYLRATDNRCNGFIDRVSAAHVVGWAYSKTQDLPVMVDVEVNGHLVKSILANQFRSDVQLIVKHHNGLVGFQYNLPPEYHLKSGDEIRVLIQTESERKEVNRSPWIFNKL